MYIYIIQSTARTKVVLLTTRKKNAIIDFNPLHYIFMISSE